MKYLFTLTFALTLALTLAQLRPSVALADSASTAADSSARTQDDLLRSYRRLLPLDGSSNFRDLGGYPTRDGRTIKRGLLFRSGAMTSLTEDDMAYLAQFDFQTVVDLRSSEELELYPNRWVDAAGIDYVYHDYSIVKLMQQALQRQGKEKQDFSSSYLHMTEMLKPQLKLYFETLLNQQVPAVVNCSAGQDRTGVTSALLLSVLGVDRTLIFEDYLLSTDFRRPQNEKGDVDLEAAAETNAFAGMMLRYSAGMKNPSRPNPLVTASGTPFVQFTFDALEAEYGSIPAYLDSELGISPEQQVQLRAMYLD
ncbi:MAG: tyrosine-protein phosphatase [Pseudomonadota bacterium]